MNLKVNAKTFCKTGDKTPDYLMQVWIQTEKRRCCKSSEIASNLVIDYIGIGVHTIRKLSITYVEKGLESYMFQWSGFRIRI